MKKQMSLFLIIGIIILSVFPCVALSQTNDSPAPWAKDAVDYLKYYQLIPNELLSLYSSNIKRDEFAAILISIYNEACQNYQTFDNQTNPFSDTNNNPYSTAIKKAYIMGFIGGTTNTTFSPDKYIKREDVATIIYRFIKLMYPSEISDFNGTISDKKDISSYALNAIQFCMGIKVMNGIGDNKFDPKGFITRQQVMVIMYNICERYQIIANGRESEVTTLSNICSGMHETIDDNYLYVKIQGYPFEFNNGIHNTSDYSLIRTPLNNDEKNQGEILLTWKRIESYAITQDKIYFCDWECIYSADKNGKNITKIRDLSLLIGVNDIPYMRVEGNWIFIGAGAVNSILKLHTDGTCISYLEKGMGSDIKYNENYIYTKSLISQSQIYSIQINRISINGATVETLFEYERNEGMEYSYYPNGDNVYLMLYNYDDIKDNTKLIKINCNNKSYDFLQNDYSSSNLTSFENDVYVTSYLDNKLNMKNITGETDYNITFPINVKGIISLIYDNYFIFLYIDYADQYTRYYSVYNTITNTYTDIYGNDLSGGQTNAPLL
jgi:S-layer homology domain.